MENFGYLGPFCARCKIFAWTRAFSHFDRNAEPRVHKAAVARKFSDQEIIENLHIFLL